MPDPTLSAAIEEAYASAPAGEVILHTLEFRHPSFTTPLRVVRDRTDHTLTLEASAPIDPSTAVGFVGFAFDLQLPDVTTGPTPEIIITIDNVSRDILGYMDQAANSADLVEVTYRPYLSTDTSAPQMDPPLTMVVRDIEADVFRITARCGFGDYANRPFPFDVYSLARFPGLVSQ
jgi:hypothetical protein